MPYYYEDHELFPIVEIYHDVVPYLAGISMHAFFTDAQLCAKAWRIANQKLKDFFGDLLQPRKPSPPPLSYGHLICLGAPVRYPEDGEPNISPLADSLDQAIDLVDQGRDLNFDDLPIVEQYRAFRRTLQQAFPEQNVPFSGLGVEGPVTSAELFRGQDFFLDIMDEPEKTTVYLEKMTDSVIRFIQWTRRVNGEECVNAAGSGLADDFASLIQPDRWRELVIPFWNRYYAALTTGRRFLHCENMVPAQLPYLKEAGIDHFQPSVADRLTLNDVRSGIDISFDWLLYAYQITGMCDEAIQQWVDQAVQAGVRQIRTQFGRYAWQAGKMDRILAFYRAFDKYRV